MVAKTSDNTARIDARAANSKAPARAKADASELVALVDRARRALTANDLRAARLLSDAAYNQAKAASAHAAAVGAAHELRAKANTMQGDAMRICALVDIAIADAVDAGQKAGQIAKKGERKAAPSNVHGGDISTLDDIGVDRRRLQEARKLRDAERREPGIVERAINARLNEGFAPTRANLRAAVGTASAPKADRGDDLYQTPHVATRALLNFEAQALADIAADGGLIWEPACGRGAISMILEDHGFEVALSDLRDRGTVTRHGECQIEADFLTMTRADAERAFGQVPQAIITNPPYDRAVMNAFIAHALREFRPRFVAMLIQWNAIAGFDDPDRLFWRDECPFDRAHLFTRRLPMMHRDDWDGKTASSRMNTAFVVWVRDGDAWRGRREIHPVDWGKLFPDDLSAQQESERARGTGHE